MSRMCLVSVHREHAIHKMNRILRQTGFTLIEIMVAVSIFTIVAVVATGALVTISEINRKTQAIKQGLDNLNFALNSMIFYLTYGGDYHCGETMSAPITDCGSPAITFEYGAIASPSTYVYKLASGQIQFSKDGGPDLPITSSSVIIYRLNFYITTPTTGLIDGFSRITIVVGGKAGSGKYLTDFNFQTTISSRGGSNVLPV